MTKAAPATALLALLSACATTPTVEPASPPPETSAPVPADCPLTIAFGSYAMGIDRAALAMVEKTLAPAELTRHRWGREGEVTLCVRPRDGASADTLARRIATKLPADPRGPITIETATGLRIDRPERE